MDRPKLILRLDCRILGGKVEYENAARARREGYVFARPRDAQQPWVLLQFKITAPDR